MCGWEMSRDPGAIHPKVEWLSERRDSGRKIFRRFDPTLPILEDGDHKPEFTVEHGLQLFTVEVYGRKHLSLCNHRVIETVVAQALVALDAGIS